MERRTMWGALLLALAAAGCARPAEVAVSAMVHPGEAGRARVAVELAEIVTP